MMRIDMEQFLALTVALGTVGAIGAAAYSARPDFQAAMSSLVEDDEVSATTDDADEPPAKAAEPSSAPTLPVPVPILADPDPDAGISPVVPDDPATYVPGPDVEIAQW